MKISIAIFSCILVKECGESSSHWSATSEDDVTHYHAYTQTTSDSAAGQTSKKHASTVKPSGYRRRERAQRMRSGRSFDPCAPEVLDSQSYPAVKGSDHGNEMTFKGGGNSSSDLSSPNETCYSFVRRAIERMSTPVNQTGNDAEHDDSGGSSSAVETRFPWLSISKLEKFSMVLFSRILYYDEQFYESYSKP